MPTKTIQTKICIIGAGPAGATTSLFLSKMQIPHLIVDAAYFPRDKVCGDALDLKVMRVLNQLNPELVKEILADQNFSKARGARVIVSKDKKYNFDFAANGCPFMLVTKRAYFDNFLISKLDNQYADLRQGTKVKKLTRKDDKWLIIADANKEEFEIHADFIVGADGDHSTVLRSLGKRKIDRQNYAGALRQYWKGISDINPGNHLEIYLPKSLPLAYLWIFPLPNNAANVGLGLSSEVIAKKSIDLKKLLHQLITEDPALKHRFQHATPLEKPVGWGLPLASQQRKASGDGYLLVGDAAGLISPTTGEGVGPGMMSGYIAARYLERAIEAGKFDVSMFINYDKEVSKRLQTEIKQYKLLTKISPRLYNLVINLCSITGIGQSYFRKNSHRWIATASKPIDVNM